MPYDTLTGTLHVKKPTVRPIASYSLFLDVQVVTLLLGEFTLFAVQRSTSPQTGHGCIFYQST